MKTTQDDTNQLDILAEIEKESVELFRTYLQNLLKFRNKGTASAAARARKAISTLSKLAKPVRKGIQTDKVIKVTERRALRDARKQA